MKIWKFPLKVDPYEIIEMPAGARLLDVQVQAGQVQLWALCDEDAPREFRGIAIYATGQPLPEEIGEYVATFQALDDALVLHVFDVTNRLRSVT